MNAGETERALDVLGRALSATWDVDKLTEGAYLLPRVFHRIAQARALNGDVDGALDLFVQAEEQFERTNVVGRAIVLRDHGFVVWQHINQKEGERLIREALQVLRQPSKTDPRWELEYVVTEGFLARLSTKKNPSKSLKTFMKVDDRVRGGNKWMYELDNLEQIIPLLPRIQRLSYLARASILSTRMVMTEEVARVGNEMMEGDVLLAPLGCMVRAANRLPKAFVTRTRALL